jgi:ABC-type sugar transport system ATPase subunit
VRPAASVLADLGIDARVLDEPSSTLGRQKVEVLFALVEGPRLTASASPTSTTG